MPPKITEILEKAKSLWTARTLSQRMIIGGLAALLTAAFVVGIMYLNRPDFRVLYSKLSAEDASKVVTMLKASKEPYQLADNGQTVLVHADRVYELRLKIAGEGNLHGQGIGFEIFDDIKIGQTDFVQHINYQRALQGELARTIMSFPKVESCRVHLVVPKKSLFIEEQTSPSAAVVIKMKEKDAKLEPKEVQGIVNLVTMAVEGLDKKHISITDQSGQPLYSPPSDDTAGMDTTELEFKSQMERKIQRRIEELLAPIVGPQKVIARVNADLDFSHKTIKRELFNPDSQVVRSETRSEETVNGKAALDGSPDPNFRGDGFNGTQSSQDSNRETRTTNYEINKEEQQIVSPVGELKRLGVAVIVDGTYTKDAKTGQMTYVPRSAQEIARIQSLVQSAVGYDKTRGDTIDVSSIAFGAEDIGEQPSMVRNFIELSGKLGKPLLTGLLILLFLILVVRPVVMALIRPKVAEQEVEEVASLPSTEERLAIEETAPEVPEEAMDTARRLEVLKNQAMQLTEQNMDQAIRLLKSWTKQEA